MGKYTEEEREKIKKEHGLTDEYIDRHEAADEAIDRMDASDPAHVMIQECVIYADEQMKKLMNGETLEDPNKLWHVQAYINHRMLNRIANRIPSMDVIGMPLSALMSDPVEGSGNSGPTVMH